MNKFYYPVDCNNVKCPFFHTCCKCATEVVKFRNSETIDIMFVGQGAGAEEDKVGRPFQGRAGKLLREKLKPLLEEFNLNIILDNTIRARPLDEYGKNRAPTDKELQYCIGFLRKVIKTFKPNVIVTLGLSATGSLVPELKNVPISHSRGHIYHVNSQKIIPTYHPAAVLHTPKMETKLMIEKAMIADIKMAIDSLSSI